MFLTMLTLLLNKLLPIVTFLFIFAVVVVVHEFGHYIAARVFGVRVFVFALGFGRRLMAVTRGHTTYAINAIPLGGYVKIAGLDDQDNAAQSYPAPESYQAKKIWQKMIIIAAGPFMNLILALFIITLFFIFQGVPGKATGFIEKVMPGMPAAAAGLSPGDKIVQVDNYPIGDMQKAIEMINRSQGRPLMLMVLHEGIVKKIVIKAVQEPNSKRYIIGINLASGDNIRYNPFVSFYMSFVETYHIIEMVIIGLVAFFSGHVPVDQVAGPIGIAQMSGQVAQQGILAVFRFLAFLSINLGVLNLIPFPALDGGRIFFLLLEPVVGKETLTLQRENYVHYAGFFVLIIFIIFVTYQDILRIFK